MKNTKCILFYFVLFLGLNSCIEFFHPDLGEISPKYVVDGVITDHEGLQTVKVSTTSKLDITKYEPLPFCKVKIMDDLGNAFDLDETLHGTYQKLIGKEYLVPGRSYKIEVVTPSGIQITSDFDQMPEGIEFDTIYYVKKDYPTSNPDKTLQGIQFYVDVDRGTHNCQYFRWDIEETWEHHAVYPLTWYLETIDGKDILKYKFPPDWSKFFCWTTKIVKNIYTLSLENFIGTKYTMKPLHIVDNQSQRLTFGYSILVNQYSISKPTYEYWEKHRVNSDTQGGLYSTQPITVKGNVKSTSNPDLEILGFFSAVSVSSKRFFVQNVEGLEKYEPTCPPPGKPYPYKFIYFMQGEGGLIGLYESCVECYFIEGTTAKPKFWPY